jgi:hypothetical protein
MGAVSETIVIVFSVNQARHRTTIIYTQHVSYYITEEVACNKDLKVAKE